MLNPDSDFASWQAQLQQLFNPASYQMPQKYMPQMMQPQQYRYGASSPTQPQPTADPMSSLAGGIGGFMGGYKGVMDSGDGAPEKGYSMMGLGKDALSRLGGLFKK